MRNSTIMFYAYIFFSKTPVLLGPLYECAMCDHKLNKWQGKEGDSTHGTQKSSLGYKHGINCKGYIGISHFDRKLFALIDTLSQYHLNFGEYLFSLPFLFLHPTSWREWRILYL